MQWTGLNELRERFLSFFESKDHARLSSASLVPKDDMSLLLINSGMAPLKNYFLGIETPPKKRAASCQKCIRTPDVERVGKTSRHGTFFEMLGNFSFGDYFKKDATKWALEFLVEDLKLPLDKLWFTVYEEDDEALDIWVKERGIPAERIVKLGKEDNFWEIGSGPCGPCSEIYFDRGPEIGCKDPGCKPGCDCDRFMEIWNLVFTQFNSDGNGTYTPLDHPNIDTGMGLERLACIMQGVDNLFEVDTVANIMKHVSRIAGINYKENEIQDISLRVITDHIRSTVFMVGDGVIPQNEGRGYVLRRLLRRAARHGRLLGIERTFLHEVCGTVIEENKSSYPELYQNRDYIKKVIKVEEERFAKTIAQGMELLSTLLDMDAKEKIKKIVSGEDAFKLYDTFGFPLDLTIEIAADKGFKVDKEKFFEFMQAQRERARKAREAQSETSWENDNTISEDFTDKFTGYSNTASETKVVGIVMDGANVKSINKGDNAVIFLAETPFYAESGGQVGDTGFIKAEGAVFSVRDTKKSPGGHIMHVGFVVDGTINEGDSAAAEIDVKRRRDIMRNHTAAHLLQAALRKVLGSHVHQSGSMVSENICRFDFSHFSAVTPGQLEQVENEVNEMILSALETSVSEMPIEQAKSLGALALFGDKYGDIVRVCRIAEKSVELCGGTHVGNTAELGLFKIISESSVAAGIRRIESTTGRGVLAYINDKDSLLNSLAGTLKVNSQQELTAKAASVTEKVKELSKEVSMLNSRLVGSRIEELTGAMPVIGGVKLLSAFLPDASIDSLKIKADEIKDKIPEIVGIFAVKGESKVSVLVFAGKKALESGIHAGKLVKEIAAVGGGSGGGRPDNAMGGIPDITKVDVALLAAESLIKAQLGQPA